MATNRDRDLLRNIAEFWMVLVIVAVLCLLCLGGVFLVSWLCTAPPTWASILILSVLLGGMTIWSVVYLTLKENLG